MTTPVCDFVRRYAESDALRLHMPGHKGRGLLGAEALDITEIAGADSLYEADGIISRSEANAGTLFGAETFYSTEGSSLAIRAMLYLAVLHAADAGRKPRIAAGRNAHRVFLSAAALLDFDVLWLYPGQPDSYLSCRIDAPSLDRALAASAEPPCAVYLTSPDYVGNTVELSAIAEVCRRHGALLLVDNAHGAYLKFLPGALHPTELGADMCCDSAHKTLPVLTGGAYLHISRHAPAWLSGHAKSALAMFGSTSPSYLILQSLDAANAALAGDYPERLTAFAQEAAACRLRLAAHGYELTGDEPLKFTVLTKPYGYTGRELAAVLGEKNIVCEFADPDFLVMMLTPELGTSGLARLEAALLAVPKRPAITQTPPVFHIPERVMSVRQAALCPAETVPAAAAAGRVLAAACVGCPPAVPIIAGGERIDESAVRCFDYYGIRSCRVVREPR